MTQSKRIKQTRIKITWYAAIVFTIFGLIAFYLMYRNEEATGTLSGIITTIITAIGAIVGFYNASEGWTKSQYIKKNQNTEQ